jgi:hypothetical protein
LDVEFVEEVNRDDIFGPGVPMKKEGPEAIREWQIWKRYEGNHGAMGANGIGWHGNWHWSQSSALVRYNLYTVDVDIVYKLVN